MSGIYGDQLSAWPEQQRSVTVYSMTAKVNGGWDVVADSSSTIIGIYQNTRGRQIKDSNGNMVTAKGLELWTREGGLDGKFLTNGDGYVYRLKESNDWSFEGGFYRYSLEKVVGNNGTESDDASWNTGANSFS